MTSSRPTFLAAGRPAGNLLVDPNGGQCINQPVALTLATVRVPQDMGLLSGMRPRYGVQ